MVGSVPNPSPGDWLEHEALGRRRSGFGKIGKLAEVADVSSVVTLYLEGEASWQRITRADLIRWWSNFTPAEVPEDVLPPTWLQPGREFHVNTANGECTARIRLVKGSWLSYEETCGTMFKDVLRIKPYREFALHGWRAVHRLSVWEWIRRPLV